MKIEQSPVNRQWMDELNEQYAYRCLPMTYASKHGWSINLLEDVKVVWHGGWNKDQTEILEGREQVPGINFVDNGTGNGIVTFHMHAVPRTPPDWNIWIMGAPNLVVPGAHPLSGIVETDWSYSALTSNWKITEPKKIITFKKGSPVLFFIPVHKTQLENFVFEHKNLSDDQDIFKNLNDFESYRSDIDSKGISSFSKTYLRGKNPDGTFPWWPHKHKKNIKLYEG